MKQTVVPLLSVFAVAQSNYNDELSAYQDYKKHLLKQSYEYGYNTEKFYGND